MKSFYFDKPGSNIIGSEKIRGKFQYVLKKEIKSIDDIDNIDSFFNDLEFPVWINFNNVKICEKIFNKLLFHEGNTYNFHNCIITEEVEFFDLNDFEIQFVNCDFNSKILNVKRCKKSVLTVKENKDLIGIVSEDCFKVVFDFIGCVFENVLFKNNKRVGIYIYNSEKSLLLNFDNNEIDELSLNSITLSKLNLNLTYIDKFNMKFCRFQKLSIISSFYNFFNEERCDINELVIWGNKFDKFFISGSEKIHLKIDYLELNYTDNVDVSYADIRKLQIQGNGYTNMLFENIKISILNIENFVNSGKFKFRLVTINSKDTTSHLSLINSVLFGIEFDGSFLHLFKNISLDDSTISGILLHYFKPIRNKVIKNAKASNSAKIEFCRELTSLMQAQNNSHYATTYRALEQNLRLNERFKKSKIFNSDTFILTLNKITNNHGTQPFLALLGLLVLIICYYFALNREFTLNDPSFNAFNIMQANIGYFFKPLTSISEVKEINYKFSFGFKIWDILYKILFAYLVYQFIAAFRKFNK